MLRVPVVEADSGVFHLSVELDFATGSSAFTMRGSGLGWAGRVNIPGE